MDKVIIPANQVPSYRTMMALKKNTANNLLFRTWGGIGDQICAEPTLRFALDTFKDVKVSLATEFPELYQHLKFHRVYDLRTEFPKYENYFLFDTINNPESLTWEFMSHCVTHCVDFPSLCALRCQVPVSYRAVKLEPKSPGPLDPLRNLLDEDYVFVHAGAHWESKTFPASWWNEVLADLVTRGFKPVLIGKELDDNRTTVNVDPTGCVDLRNKTTLSETIWLLKWARYVVTNDSSPMHMAAPGTAHIAFVATAKHHDYLYHWRKPPFADEPVWGWRMKHFNSGGMWDLADNCPNKESNVTVDKCDPEILKTWLPEPTVFADWFSYMKKVDNGPF